MLAAFVIVLPLIIGAVLVASGALKVGRPIDDHEAASLGVPRVLRSRALLRLHPWAELLLGLAVVCLGGVLGALAAAAAAVLMGAYLWLVARARRSSPDASCSCFGARRPVTRLTVIRNAWLTLVAVGAAAVTWRNPPFGGALAAVTGEALTWVIAALVAVVTAVLVVAPDGSSADQSAGAQHDDDDYQRVRTPAVAVTRADGTATDLRQLTSVRPVLLLAVSETCGSCRAVIDAVPAWRARLPEVGIHLLVTRPPHLSDLTETAEPQTLHDEMHLVSQSLGPWPTPAAVLLGADGMLAGGPVTGGDSVASFVDEIEATLREG